MTAPGPEVTAVEAELAQFRTYLQAAGWQTIADDDRQTVWRLSQAERELVIALPVSASFRDVGRDIAGAWATLAAAERRSIREVQADLGSGGADSVSVRLVPPSPSGTAPLPLAHEAIGALRQYVAGSASALFNNSLVLPSRRPAEAERYVSSVGFGTSRGSFVLDLTLPLGASAAEEPEALIPNAQPLGRRVAERMQTTAHRAVDLASRIIANGGPVSDFAEPTGRLGNATELEALAGLGADRLTYRLRFTQSALVASHAPVWLLEVSREQQEVLRDAADYLRQIQSQEGITLEGLVVRLFREASTGPGDVTVSAVMDDSGRERRCKMNLAPEDYALASRAHLEGLRVRVTGDLVSVGRQKRLDRPIGFNVVDDALSMG